VQLHCSVLALVITLNPNPIPSLACAARDPKISLIDLQPISLQLLVKFRVLTSTLRRALTMASLRGLSRPVRSLPLSQLPRQTYTACSIRCASSQAAKAEAEEDLQELETDSLLHAPPLSEEEKRQFRPWKRALDRQFMLPSGRYATAT
jgi:hypothetical protein